MIHQFEELNHVPLVFDEETEKIFFEEFTPVKQDFCPTCKSEDVVHYADLFCCFNCKKKCPSKFWNIRMYRGYIIIESDDKKIFFHRFVMDSEIKKVPKFERKDFHIHHLDEIKTNNSKVNLVLMDAEEHRRYHEQRRFSKGFNTWCQKNYGCVDQSHIEEFERWLENKQEGVQW